MIVLVIVGILLGYMFLSSENVELMVFSRKFKRFTIGVDYSVTNSSVYSVHTLEIGLVMVFISLTFTRYQT